MVHGQLVTAPALMTFPWKGFAVWYVPSLELTRIKMVQKYTGGDLLKTIWVVTAKILMSNEHYGGVNVIGYICRVGYSREPSFQRISPTYVVEPVQ
jgi:hypothetical protein